MSLSTERTSVWVPDTACQVLVLTDRCAGCQECIVRCPTGALSLDRGRWVAVADDQLCVGCRQCVRTCPFSAIKVTGTAQVAVRVLTDAVHTESLLGDTSEIHQGFATWSEALTEANRCLLCPDPTCVRGCPAHNDIPGFISALRDRDLQRAHDVLRKTTVLPDVCSRVCNQSAQCEGACSWSLAGEAPVSIGRLERFVADHTPCPPPDRKESRGEALNVAIVGGGPAGIGAAWQLIEKGADVTVYEKATRAGGLLDWGIPDFTLPRNVASRPWRQLVDAGVNLRCDTAIRPDDIDRLLTQHDAVLLAVGASQAMRMSIPGADLDGVIDATKFLQGAKTALQPEGDPSTFLCGLGLAGNGTGSNRRAQKVLVLGAGNTAMDVARTARRFGLEATCIDWLDERFALARPDELDEARREGVTVSFSRTLTGLSGNEGRVTRAKLARTTQARPDRLPKVARRAPEELRVDLVVMAMGYRLDPEFARLLPSLPVRRQSKGMPDRRWIASGILANPASAFAHHSHVGSLALGREVGLAAATLPVRDRLWVIGDGLVGPSTVVEAMTQGRRAAAAVLAGNSRRARRSD
jgi:glutamate synthase (NADPH/NADH) small chain